MTDIQGLRARMREERGRPVAATGAGFRIPFGLLAGAAVILGFIVVMFTPKIYSVQRTAALPGFKEARERAPEPALAVSAPAPVAAVSAPPPVAVVSAPAPIASAQYAGKSVEETGRGGVCAARGPGAKRAAGAVFGRRGGREAFLLSQRGSGALLLGQPEAQGDRRYH
jgi:hypothetical protein